METGKGGDEGVTASTAGPNEKGSSASNASERIVRAWWETRDSEIGAVRRGWMRADLLYRVVCPNAGGCGLKTAR